MPLLPDPRTLPIDIVILSGVNGLARESVHGVERPAVCLDINLFLDNFLSEFTEARCPPTENRFLDSAGSFAPERSCSARDDRWRGTAGLPHSRMR